MYKIIFTDSYEERVKKFLKKHPDLKNNSLFAYALVLLKRLPDQKSKKSYVEAIKVLMEQYEEDIDMSLIGFPDDYLEILENNICWLLNKKYQ